MQIKDVKSTSYLCTKSWCISSGENVMHLFFYLFYCIVSSINLTQHRCLVCSQSQGQEFRNTHMHSRKQQHGSQPCAEVIVENRNNKSHVWKYFVLEADEQVNVVESQKTNPKKQVG